MSPKITDLGFTSPSTNSRSWDKNHLVGSDHLNKFKENKCSLKTSTCGANHISQEYLSDVVGLSRVPLGRNREAKLEIKQCAFSLACVNITWSSLGSMFALWSVRLMVESIFQKFCLAFGTPNSHFCLWHQFAPLFHNLFTPFLCLCWAESNLVIAPPPSTSSFSFPIEKMKVWITQSPPTLCNPKNYSLPGTSVPGILQARILEWVAIPFSRGSSQPRGRTQVSCIAGRFFTNRGTREAPFTFTITYLLQISFLSASWAFYALSPFQSLVNGRRAITARYFLKWTYEKPTALNNNTWHSYLSHAVNPKTFSLKILSLSYQRLVVSLTAVSLIYSSHFWAMEEIF